MNLLNFSTRNYPAERTVPQPLGARRTAFSLIELLCVMAIIAVLASLFLGAAGRVFQRVKAFAGESDSYVHLDELRTKLSQYASADPKFPTLTLDDLVQRCALSSGCARFLRSKEVTFFPFAGSSPGNMIILQVGRGKGGVVAYPKAALCVPPEEN